MRRILIAEDHLMVRAGLRALLERMAEISIVGEASNGIEAVELSASLKPDILLMDIMMPRLNGIQAAERIRDMKLPVQIILLSMYSDEGLIRQSMLCGAKGYVLKTSASEELLEAVEAVSCGKTYLSAALNNLAEDHFHGQENAAEDPLDLLSPREKEILQLIAEAHTSSKIAEMLFISEKTVEKYRASMMRKLNIHNLAGLVRFAIKSGLVDKNA